MVAITMTDDHAINLIHYPPSGMARLPLDQFHLFFVWVQSHKASSVALFQLKRRALPYTEHLSAKITREQRRRLMGVKNIQVDQGKPINLER